MLLVHRKAWIQGASTAGALLALLGGQACGGTGDSGNGGGAATTGSGAGKGSGSTGAGSAPPGKTCSNCTPTGDMTFTLPSPAGATLWTTTTMDKILKEAKAPSTKGAAIALSAAKNEFEPFQIAVLADADGDVTLSLSAFKGPSGKITRVEVRRVGYVQIAKPSDPSSIPSSAIPDPLYLSSFGKSESVSKGENQPFWITVYVPADATAGDYTATLTVKVNGKSQDVPVNLHVYNFALPEKIGFDGDWNAGFEDLGGSASLDAVKSLKTFFFEHRLTPSGVAWPAGLNYNGGVTYDCKTGKINDYQGGGYGLDVLGPEYIDGKGWNGVGFPSFEVMQFVDNSTPRPDTFCGETRGDVYGSDAYNAAWSKLLASVAAYEVKQGWQKKGYYYVQNEPQNQSDYDVAAFLADLSKTAAPALRIAISEEPKPEIAENLKAKGNSYDLWWADLSNFKADYATKRQALGETVWWYFLYGDLPPFFNPITIDHEGIESRIPFWGAWKYRVKGFAYYSVTGWGTDPVNDPTPMGTNQNGDGFLLYPPNADGLVTSIRWELLREGAEDYEYLLLAAGGSAPLTSDTKTGCDASVESAVSSPTAYTRDSSAFKHLRDELGSMLEGKANGCPKLDSTLPGAHKKAAYYINFQDPNGDPKADPLVVDGHTWIKIGWAAYDPKKGYGWAGQNIGDPTIMLYQYQADAPGNELQKSIIYDDYGRTDTFNWDIENGKYKVTVGIGWYNGNYPQNEVVVEGQSLFHDAVIDAGHPYSQKSIDVDVSDGNVTLEVGKFNQYTMLDWMSIEPE